MLKFAHLTLAGAIVASLSACGSSASSASKPAAPAPSSSAAAAAKPSASAAAAVPSAAVVGQKAPGPYSASGSVTASGGQAAMEATDSLQWKPNTVIAKAGDKVTLQIKNGGNTAHTFTSPALGVNGTEDVSIGKTASISFNAPSAPGAYQFWCNIPGHAESGMVGEVIVQ